MICNYDAKDNVTNVWLWRNVRVKFAREEPITELHQNQQLPLSDCLIFKKDVLLHWVQAASIFTFTVIHDINAFVAYEKWPLSTSHLEFSWYALHW